MEFAGLGKQNQICKYGNLCSLLFPHLLLFFHIFLNPYQNLLEFAGFNKQNQIIKHGNPHFLFFPDLLLFFHIFPNPYWGLYGVCRIEQTKPNIQIWQPMFSIFFSDLSLFFHIFPNPYQSLHGVCKELGVVYRSLIDLVLRESHPPMESQEFDRTLTGPRLDTTFFG